jgi:OmpA-OmpF porin, OOP family
VERNVLLNGGDAEGGVKDPPKIRRSVMRTPIPIMMFLLSLSLSASPAAAEETAELPLGREAKIEGVIVARTESDFRVRSHDDREWRVVVAPDTRVGERKRNPFRSADRFEEDDLILGLNVRVEGRGDTSGALLADRIRFTRDELKVAQTISSRVAPVEHQLAETEGRLLSTEERLALNEERLVTTAESFQAHVEELGDAFQLARRDARDAQETAGEAMEKATLVERRLSALDSYVEATRLVVNFGFDSRELSDENRQELDRLAEQVARQRGYLVEVTGFASSDGDPAYNRRLSEMRADAVVAYLAEHRDIPLWRIVRPHGFGESNPVADNSTREGRHMNRRVEVRVLKSEGLVDDRAEAVASTQTASRP